MKSRRRTATLTLVLIGAATLPACGRDEAAATRDVYRSRADCQRDWGDEDKKCEAVSSGPHAGYFYGPMRSEEYTSELQSRRDLVCRLLLEKKRGQRSTNRRRG